MASTFRCQEGFQPKMKQYYLFALKKGWKIHFYGIRNH